MPVGVGEDRALALDPDVSGFVRLEVMQGVDEVGPVTRDQRGVSRNDGGHDCVAA